MLKLRHADDQMLLLGRKSATKRFASLLREGRFAVAGVMVLLGNRREIGDCVGFFKSCFVMPTLARRHLATCPVRTRSHRRLR